jgi:hypothetical protein
MADEALGAKLAAPSVSAGSQNLYMRGVLEEATRENLARVWPHTLPHTLPLLLWMLSQGPDLSACSMVLASCLLSGARIHSAFMSSCAHAGGYYGTHKMMHAGILRQGAAGACPQNI